MKAWVGRSICGDVLTESACWHTVSTQAQLHLLFLTHAFLEINKQSEYFLVFPAVLIYLLLSKHLLCLLSLPFYTIHSINYVAMQPFIHHSTFLQLSLNPYIFLTFIVSISVSWFFCANSHYFPKITFSFL